MTGPAPIVAFDLDGTLLDCRPRQVALAAALVGPGFRADAFWAAKRAGATTAVALRAIGVEATAARRHARDWAAAVEEDAWLARDTVLPGAPAALAAVRAAGGSAFVLTARRRADAVRRQLEGLGLAGAVDAVEVVDPARASEEKAAALARRQAGALIGDTESDARAAHAAGVAFAAVACGQRSRGWLARRGIAPVHDDVRAAVAAVLGPRA